MDFKSTTISYFKLIHFLVELKQLQASHPQSWHTLQFKENHSFSLSQYNSHTSFRGIQWLLWSSRSSLWRAAKAKGVQTHSCPSQRSLRSCSQHVGLHCSQTPPCEPPPSHIWRGGSRAKVTKGDLILDATVAKCPPHLTAQGFLPRKKRFQHQTSSFLVLLFEQRSSLLVLGWKWKLSLSLCSLSEWKINNWIVKQDGVCCCWGMLQPASRESDPCSKKSAQKTDRTLGKCLINTRERQRV